MPSPQASLLPTCPPCPRGLLPVALPPAWALPCPDVRLCSRRACVGLPPQNHMLLEHKMQRPWLSQKWACPAEPSCPVSSKKVAAQVNGHVCPASSGPGASHACLCADRDK